MANANAQLISSSPSVELILERASKRVDLCRAEVDSLGLFGDTRQYSPTVGNTRQHSAILGNTRLHPARRPIKTLCALSASASSAHAPPAKPSNARERPVRPSSGSVEHSARLAADEMFRRPEFESTSERCHNSSLRLNLSAPKRTAASQSKQSRAEPSQAKQRKPQAKLARSHANKPQDSRARGRSE